MNIDLSGKTAVVTGGNIGIGGAISLALAKCGADVAITYFEGDLETAKAIEEMGRKAPVFQLDATDSDQVNQVISGAAAALGGKIDILVNNAGGLVGRVHIPEMSDEFWYKVIDVNLSSAFCCTRAVSPFMPACETLARPLTLIPHIGPCETFARSDPLIPPRPSWEINARPPTFSPLSEPCPTSARPPTLTPSIRPPVTNASPPTLTPCIEPSETPARIPTATPAE